MARYSAGVRTGAGSTTLPLFSVYSGGATNRPALREIGAFNTTTTALVIRLVRLTTAGTQGAGVVRTPHDSVSAAITTAFTTHTVAPTLGADLGYTASLGAAVGSGIVWTFGDTGLVIPAGTGNGIGIIVATGTGQVLDVYGVWDE